MASGTGEMLCNDKWDIRLNQIDAPVQTVFTIGHSTHTLSNFLAILRSHSVDAIADVRTSPFSRHFPHFSRHDLKSSLTADGIKYSFLGKELGGRPSDSAFYCDGIADYEKMAETSAFAEGLQRIIAGAKQYTIALMCSEKNPLDCHRCLLVGRALLARNVKVQNILADGSLIDQEEIERHLLSLLDGGTPDMFATPHQILSRAYRERSIKVAYSEQLDNGELVKPGDNQN